MNTAVLDNEVLGNCDRFAPVELGNARLELSCTDSGEFLGLGAVQCGGIELRNGKRPMFAVIRNPWGVELCRHRLLGRRILDEGGVELICQADRSDSGPMEWMLHATRSRQNTFDWSQPSRVSSKTFLRLELHSVNRRLGPFELNGFSYRYHFQSPDIPIYKILDRGTWEIDGSAIGNSIWMRQCHNESIVSIANAETSYSTEWYLPTISQPNIFQFHPLQTQLQGFTFTVHKTGVLVTWATQVAHIRTLLEKSKGQDVICHWHEHCGDLKNDFSTVPVEVLWCEGAFNRVELFNLYEHVKELVHRTLHAESHLRRDRITTYGCIEQWDNADLRRYRTHGLPKLLEAGCKTIFLANHFENNMNVYGVTNMCCTVDYKVAESVGEENLAELCQDALAGDAQVQMWGNTSLSTLSWILSQRAGKPSRIDFLPLENSIMDVLRTAVEPFVCNPSGAIDADHYTPVFAVLNLRDPVVRDYWRRSWQHAHDRIGLRGVFLDSSFNLSSDKFHWVYNSLITGRNGATNDQVTSLGQSRPEIEPKSAILSQYHAHLDLVREMQQMGFHYSGEDLGVFGINRCGSPHVLQRLQSLPMWSNTYATFDIPSLCDAGLNPDDVFFRGLAYRMMWSLRWDPNVDGLQWGLNSPKHAKDVPSRLQLSLLRAFNKVEHLMQSRTILPKEAGVLYECESGCVLWAFSTIEVPLGDKVAIHDVLQDCTQEDSCLSAEAGQILTLPQLDIGAVYLYLKKSADRNSSVASSYC